MFSKRRRSSGDLGPQVASKRRRVSVDEQILEAMIRSIPTIYMSEGELALVVDHIVTYIEKKGVPKTVPIRLHCRESGNCGAELRVLMGLEKRGVRVTEFVAMDSIYKDEDVVPKEVLQVWANLRQAQYTVLTSYPELTDHALKVDLDDHSLILVIGIHTNWSYALPWDPIRQEVPSKEYRPWLYDTNNIRQSWWDVMAKLADLNLAFPDSISAFSAFSTYEAFTILDTPFRDGGEEEWSKHFQKLTAFQKIWHPELTPAQIKANHPFKRGGAKSRRRKTRKRTRKT